jgi:hypothetical protein
VSSGSRGGAQRWAKVQGNLDHGPDAGYVVRVDAEGESFRCHTGAFVHALLPRSFWRRIYLVASVLRFVAAMIDRGFRDCRGAVTARGVAGGTMDPDQHGDRQIHPDVRFLCV